MVVAPPVMLLLLVVLLLIVLPLLFIHCEPSTASSVASSASSYGWGFFFVD
jgi:hypothetical protein